ncbi:hypothetical protein ANANG_G00073650 [Anguilla anguilla]|uniref:Uncharacterized protein n=1 Tax=Anguilla anguilla TaxID=7936 RepID=A0A9D3MQZ7_ANGAN|nr:hypothetical protein ANANG_G00073650 [Anguilla anguilla]
MFNYEGPGELQALLVFVFNLKSAPSSDQTQATRRSELTVHSTSLTEGDPAGPWNAQLECFAAEESGLEVLGHTLQDSCTAAIFTRAVPSSMSGGSPPTKTLRE